MLSVKENRKKRERESGKCRDVAYAYQASYYVYVHTYIFIVILYISIYVAKDAGPPSRATERCWRAAS